MRHDLITLELLLAVAQERSVTRGAEAVHLAVAAASRRITDMEARLRVNLFIRKARGVEPTEACRSLLGHIQTIRSGLDAFNREAAQHSSVRYGTARAHAEGGRPEG
ncbi:LysR family transcriptional regulator [Roseateles violae]|uniref:LysR family transcriptional regulator n=1 Tax=Roseateles violae TaxID=3058042 RepID=UPI003312FB92